MTDPISEGSLDLALLLLQKEEEIFELKQRLREASKLQDVLSWYGNPYNYRQRRWGLPHQDEDAAVIEDNGDRAREALSLHSFQNETDRNTARLTIALGHALDGLSVFEQQALPIMLQHGEKLTDEAISFHQPRIKSAIALRKAMEETLNRRNPDWKRSAR